MTKNSGIVELGRDTPGWAAFLAATYDNRRYFPVGDIHNPSQCFKPSETLDIVSGWKKTLRLIREGVAPPEISLYIHWPFCPSQCSFCFCQMAVPQGREIVKEGLQALKNEIDLFSPIFSEIFLSSLYIGGGTPTFMDDDMLDDFLTYIKRSFNFVAGAEIYSESSPGTLTKSKLDILLRHGFNRIAMGIETFNEKLLGSLNRKGQTRENSIEAFQMVSRISNLTTDIDLIVGLEGQTPSIFIKDMETALSLKPDCMHLYLFKDSPQTQFNQNGGLLSIEQRAQMEHLLELADYMAGKAGYRSDECKSSILCDSESTREAPWRRGKGSILALGYGTVSHAFGSLWYHHEMIPASRELPHPVVPPFFSVDFSIEEEMRSFIIGFLGENKFVSRGSFHSLFGADMLEVDCLSPILLYMEREGLIRIDKNVLCWQTEDWLKKAIALKNLYSPLIRDRVLSADHNRFQDFLKRYAAGDQEWRKSVIHSYSRRDCRIYYRMNQQ